MGISIIIGIVIVGGGFYFLITSLPKKPKKKKSGGNGSNSTKLVDAEEPDETNEGIPNTGKIIQVAEKSWVLNPRSPFPLTVYGIDGAQALEIKKLLDNRYKTTATETLRKLLPFITEHNIGCKEIDEYVKVFRPIYQNKFEDYKAEAATFTGAKATAAQKQALSDAEDKAAGELDIELHCDLPILFRGHPRGKRSKEELIKKFGADVMKLYVSLRKGINTVDSTPEVRKAFAKLEEFRLVAHGANANPKLLLKTLSLKNMRKIVQDLSYPVFETKEDAYKAISMLPDLSNRLKNVVSMKTIYEKLPIPRNKDEIEVSELEHADYLSEFANLLSTTYFKSGVSILERKEFEGKSYSFVKGWEISAKKDACKYCKKQAEKKFEKKDYPRTPIHLGCRCTVMTA